MPVKAAYVGTLTDGSTSRMRADWLKKITSTMEWTWIDTDSKILESSRIWQSIAYRMKAGSAVARLNEFVSAQIENQRFDLIWVDKAIFLEPDTVARLRSATRRLAHFTPDTAFRAGRSRHFDRTLGVYDLLVTTKSFDVEEYRRLAGRDTVHLTTQGYDPRVHYPRNTNSERRDEVVFVGLAETEREKCISTLLDAGIAVRLGGFGWERFQSTRKADANLRYVRDGSFGGDYAGVLSGAWVGLGLLSKKFPEQHTTRTFEIPACGTVLATERTEETVRFFGPEDALFFDDYFQLARSITNLFSGDRARLASLAERGQQRVVRDGRDYQSILSMALADPRLDLNLGE